MKEETAKKVSLSGDQAVIYLALAKLKVTDAETLYGEIKDVLGYRSPFKLYKALHVLESMALVDVKFTKPRRWMIINKKWRPFVEVIQ